MTSHLEQEPVRTDHKAVAALLLGLLPICAIAGFAIVGIPRVSVFNRLDAPEWRPVPFYTNTFIGISAIIIGILSRVDIWKSGGRLTGRQLANWGIGLGIVTGLLIPLVAIVFYLVFTFPFLEDARVDAAKAKIATLEAAVKAYKKKEGNYPDSLTVLTQPQNDGRPAYLDETDIIDPWGNPFRYEPSSLRPTTGIPHIYSVGPKCESMIDNWGP